MTRMMRLKQPAGNCATPFVLHNVYFTTRTQASTESDQSTPRARCVTFELMNAKEGGQIPIGLAR